MVATSYTLHTTLHMLFVLIIIMSNMRPQRLSCLQILIAGIVVKKGCDIYQKRK